MTLKILYATKRVHNMIFLRFIIKNFIHQFKKKLKL